MPFVTKNGQRFFINVSDREQERIKHEKILKADKQLRGLELISKEREELCLKKIQSEHEHRRRLQGIREQQGIFP